MTGMGLTPCWPPVAEDIRDLQSRARHLGPASAGWPRFLQLERNVL